jgi:hypothetical protein
MTKEMTPLLMILFEPFMQGLSILSPFINDTKRKFSIAIKGAITCFDTFLPQAVPILGSESLVAK